MPIVQPFLDPANCVGLKGSSISHYLIRLLHFIHSSVHRPAPHAVVLALVDLLKAFNRVDHSLVIQDLHDMKVPEWLLKMLISYLTNISMILNYKLQLQLRNAFLDPLPKKYFLDVSFSW